MLQILQRATPSPVAVEQRLANGRQLCVGVVEPRLQGRVGGANSLEASRGDRRREAIEKSSQLLVQHTLYRVHRRHLPYGLNTKQMLTGCQGQWFRTVCVMGEAAAIFARGGKITRLRRDSPHPDAASLVRHTCTTSARGRTMRDRSRSFA